MLRRSLMRWMNLAMILVLRSISSAVKQRFPTLDHVVEAGFMTVNEKKLFESVPANEFNTYWVPCTWFIFRLQEATKQGRLLNQYALESIMRVRQGWCFLLLQFICSRIALSARAKSQSKAFIVFFPSGRYLVDISSKAKSLSIGQ